MIFFFFFQFWNLLSFCPLYNAEQRELIKSNSLYKLLPFTITRYREEDFFNKKKKISFITEWIFAEFWKFYNNLNQWVTENSSRFILTFWNLIENNNNN